MPTHKQRILTALKGEMPDTLPYVPRIDLWYNANVAFDTLPAQHQGRTQDEISRAQGWALHKIVPEFSRVLLRGNADGIYGFREECDGFIYFALGAAKACHEDCECPIQFRCSHGVTPALANE